jgi:hypothetical protein
MRVSCFWQPRNASSTRHGTLGQDGCRTNRLEMNRLNIELDPLPSIKALASFAYYRFIWFYLPVDYVSATKRR